MSHASLSREYDEKKRKIDTKNMSGERLLESRVGDDNQCGIPLDQIVMMSPDYEEESDDRLEMLRHTDPLDETPVPPAPKGTGFNWGS